MEFGWLWGGKEEGKHCQEPGHCKCSVWDHNHQLCHWPTCLSGPTLQQRIWDRGISKWRLVEIEDAGKFLTTWHVHTTLLQETILLLDILNYIFTMELCDFFKKHICRWYKSATLPVYLNSNMISNRLHNIPCLIYCLSLKSINTQQNNY